MKKMIRPLISIIVLIAVSTMHYGCCSYRKYQTWEEEKFLGRKREDLEKKLQSRDISLQTLNGPFSIAERANFERLTGKTISENQKLYIFWQKQKYKFLIIMGTVHLGAYVITEDGVITEIIKTESVDSI